MDTLSYKTKSANNAVIQKNWLVIDAKGAVLGRLASEAARLLRGKQKTNFTPHLDCGDHVIIINAAGIRLTGDKWEGRRHFRHTGYPGGQRREAPADIHRKDQTRLVEQAVRGMLPKNKLSRKIFGNLHVFAGPEHSHEAQQPTAHKLN